MKIIDIFQKNLKTVARNWKYFFVLFLCPILLIIISAIVLNSNDISNLKIGVVDENDNYDFERIGFKSYTPYSTIENCLSKISSSKVSACFHISLVGELTQIDVYIDNRLKSVESFAKQYVLQNLVKEQNTLIEEVSTDMDVKLNIYLASIIQTKGDLIETETQLEEQETVLIGYQSDVAQLRSDFELVYWPLKNSLIEARSFKENYSESYANLKSNISTFRENQENIFSNIQTIRFFLGNRLSTPDFSYVDGLLDEIESSFLGINSDLNNLETLYANSQMLNLISDLEEIESNLDEIRNMLEKVDTDLALAIQMIQENRNKINLYIVKLDEMTLELSGLSENYSSLNTNIDFKRAFNFSSDPVFLVFPLLIALIITFTSMVLSNMFILKQVNSASYVRDIMSPARDIYFFISDYLLNLFFVSIQAAVLFFIGNYFFGVSFDKLPLFILAIFLISSFFIFMGMSLGYIIKHQNLSMLITIFLLIILLILSDLLSPSILAGFFVKFVIEMNPLVLLYQTLRDLFLLDRGFYELSNNFFIMGFYFIVSFFIGFISKKISKENAIK